MEWKKIRVPLESTTHLWHGRCEGRKVITISEREGKVTQARVNSIVYYNREHLLNHASRILQAALQWEQIENGETDE